MRFRKRPVEIEAWCNAQQGEGMPDWVLADAVETDDGALIIRTLEGDMRADVGDWLVQGVKGEVYPVKPDIFVATYEKVE